MVAYNRKSSTWRIWSKEDQELVQSQLWLHNQFKASLSYKSTLSHKNRKQANILPTPKIPHKQQNKTLKAFYWESCTFSLEAIDNHIEGLKSNLRFGSQDFKSRIYHFLVLWNIFTLFEVQVFIFSVTYVLEYYNDKCTKIVKYTTLPWKCPGLWLWKELIIETFNVTNLLNVFIFYDKISLCKYTIISDSNPGEMRLQHHAQQSGYTVKKFFTYNQL